VRWAWAIYSVYVSISHVNRILYVLNDSNRKVEANREAIVELIHSKSVIQKNLEILSTRGAMIFSDAGTNGRHRIDAGK
jgi:N-acetylmuramic acid 6-phosphate (MurNAc-6-P) etherase